MIELQLIAIIAAYILSYVLILRPMIEEEYMHAAGGPRIVGFAGHAGSGKTTCAGILCTYANYQDRPMAGPLKAALGELFGFRQRQLHGDKKEIIDEYWGKSPREIMQFIGTEIFRGRVSEFLGIGDEFWIRAHARSIQTDPATMGTRGYVISDVRFQNEVDYIHRLGGIVIRIVRDDTRDDTRDNTRDDTCEDTRDDTRDDTHADTSKHISERPDDLRGVDMVITNNGTITELREKLMRALKL